MRHFLQYFCTFIFCCITPLIFSHGFGPSTYIKTDRGFSTIKQLSLHAKSKKQKVWSFDADSHNTSYKTIISAAHSTTNCYVRLRFDTDKRNDVLCTPPQEFYVPEQQRWIPACQLTTGDQLLSDGYKPIVIVDIELIEKSLQVYSLEIDEWHTFFVGFHAIVTHNMVCPAMMVCNPLFASGTAATFIGSLNPPMALGILAGGIIIGVAVQTIGKEIARYGLSYNIAQVKQELSRFADVNKMDPRLPPAPPQNPPNEPPSQPEPPEKPDKIPEKIKQAIETSVKWLMRKDKIIHLFENSEHLLGPLLAKFGSEEAAARAILAAAYMCNNLPNDGVFKDIPVNVEGFVVTIRGFVIDGIIKVGTFFIKQGI